MKNLTLKIQKLLILFGALLILFVAPEIARACSCVKSSPVDVEFARSKNVVILKLQRVEKRAEGEEGYGYGGVRQSKLTIEKVFKGNLKIGEELIFTQGGGGDCIWTFDENDVGEQYLFYLDAKPVKDKIWAAFTCSRSGGIDYRRADLLYLENQAKVSGKTRLSGAVTQAKRPVVEGDQYSNEPLAGRKIRIVGNGKNVELKTDRYGVYEIYDLPPGKYRITPEKIGGYKVFDDGSESIEVGIMPKSHTEQDFEFVIDNRIRGRFFDSGGKPLKDVCLDLIPARGEKAQYFYEADCTDENGKFEFDEVPAGTYLLVVNDDNEISADEPFPMFYYPNAKRREDAAEITIGAGDFIDDLIVNAPETVETVTISGFLLFEDGKPVAKESIEFFAQKTETEKDDEADSRETTDAKGRFSLRVLKGQKGRLLGSMYTYIGEYEKCPKLDKILRAKGDEISDIETPAIEIDGSNDLHNVEVRFPFPGCKKAKDE